jgi:hypothetical protein
MSHSEFALHLWSMTSGHPHPDAENPIISYSRIREATTSVEVNSISITNSRLAILVGHPNPMKGVEVVVWDWRTGRILLVSDPHASVTAPDPTKISG